ncbi:MAG: peptide deformylase [Desulfurivibrionaceae bacterium]|nr:peptide deformylase [Desulfurivibrionaceae bacterium]
MPILPILKYPNQTLRRKAAPVREFDAELVALVEDMAETMYAAPGVGLAAPQIGVSKQILVYDPATAEEKGNYTALINPRIVEAEGEEIGEEGCLSVRELCAEVKRAYRIVVEARDLEGSRLNFEAEGWPARVLQHEIDHLNGILFIDHLSSLKRTLYKKKLKKIIEAEKQGDIGKSAG